MSFPKTFSWGAASASYQIEGGAFEDGKGLSIWDSFTHTPGKTFNGQTGDQSCDAYHRYEEDLDLLEELGIKNYRFSLSWPRVIPDGSGKVNPAGLAYYDRLVDGCLKRGIIPWITLYRPRGTFYLFPGIEKTGLTDTEFCRFLLDEAHILVSPGSAFGKAGKGHFRIAATVPISRLDEAVNRMESA